MSLSYDEAPDTTFGRNPNAMLVSKSTDGGLTWRDPVTLIRDANLKRFNDKNTITADPNDSRFVYAVWDRLAKIGTVIRGPTVFTRTTNGGASWEEARVIFNPGDFAQTVGNQIAVRPQGDLINISTLIRNVSRPGAPLLDVTVMRSGDNGQTWSGPIRFAKMVNPGVVDPDDGDSVRTSDIIPDIAVDPSSGQLYAVWQDKRFDDGRHDGVALSTSTDGGLTWSSAADSSSATMRALRTTWPEKAPTSRPSSRGRRGWTLPPRSDASPGGGSWERSRRGAAKRGKTNFAEGARRERRLDGLLRSRHVRRVRHVLRRSSIWEGSEPNSWDSGFLDSSKWLAGCFFWLWQSAHYCAQTKVPGQIRGEASDAQDPSGINDHLASGQVWEDRAGGVDRILSLKTHEALAPSGLLLPHSVEAHLSSAGAADHHPVPVEDEGFVGSQRPPRLRCQAHVEIITIHVMSLPKPPNAKRPKYSRTGATNTPPKPSTMLGE
jgi:hypothetical protein